MPSVGNDSKRRTLRTPKAKIFEQPIGKPMFLTYYLFLREEKEIRNRKLATESHNSLN
jgi:hypothetical protein